MIIGIGTDLIEVARIRKSIENPAFLAKVFSVEELRVCQDKPSQAQSLAARFAAKEACLKALGTGWSEGLGFKEIEVLNDERGSPKLQLSGKSAQKAKELGVSKTHVSLSHLKEMAIATVILEK